MVDYKPPGTNIRAKSGIEPGVYILPTDCDGDSPFTAKLTIVATPGTGDSVVTEYALNTDDGQILKGTFKYHDGEARAIVTYVYKYAQGQTKYTGHTFYPDVTIATKDGGIKTMNHNKQHACSVWVRDPAKTPK